MQTYPVIACFVGEKPSSSGTSWDVLWHLRKLLDKRKDLAFHWYECVEIHQVCLVFVWFDWISLISDEETKFCLKDILSFKNITFKNRDELIEIFYSWARIEPYDMEKYRDQRMRYLNKERYDHRRNMADYDYHFKLSEKAEIINYRQYLAWRENGVAFESRFSSYIVPNRTMSSYLPGIKVTKPHFS